MGIRDKHLKGRPLGMTVGEGLLATRLEELISEQQQTNRLLEAVLASGGRSDDPAAAAGPGDSGR
jgi:hypothetical protein